MQYGVRCGNAAKISEGCINQWLTEHTTATSLPLTNLNKTVSLAGWVDTIRDHGGVAFIDLRDQYGVTQIVINNDELLEGVKRKALSRLREKS